MSHWYQKLPFQNWQRNFPFQSAILHSPMIQPILPVQLRVIVDQILVLVGRLVSQPLTRISELRDLPYEALYAVNRAMVRESPHGTFTFGPSADYAKGHRSYVPDTPLRRLKAGEMASSVNVF
ncbi:putative carboxylesterase family protein, partial [Erysiphe neolycopersici]